MLTSIHGDDAYRYPDIRMNFSSNIFSHADLSLLKQHLCNCMDAISSYPQPEPLRLEAMIAEREGIDAECVMVGSGATELIYCIAAVMKERRYKVHNPTFSEYERACRTFGMCEATENIPADVEWICNPNNPDGRVWEKKHLLQHIEEHPARLFVIDASYEDYTLAELPATAELLQFPNVLCLHSMTKKYCIPGLRLGYSIGNEGMIGKMKAIRQPWSVNALAQEAGCYLLQNNVSVLPPMEEYIAEARRLAEAVNSIDGFTAEIHDTHFFLCTAPCEASELKEHLALEHGILIRDASNFHTLTPQHFRLAAQTREENDALLKILSGRKFAKLH